MFLTEGQRALLEPARRAPRASHLGRPSADPRRVFEALLFVLHTGIQWKHPPQTFLPKSTVHDYPTQRRRAAPSACPRPAWCAS